MLKSLAVLSLGLGIVTTSSAWADKAGRHSLPPETKGDLTINAGQAWITSDDSIRIKGFAGKSLFGALETIKAKSNNKTGTVLEAKIRCVETNDSEEVVNHGPFNGEGSIMYISNATHCDIIRE